MSLTKEEIAALVDEGAKLADAIAPLEKKKARLDQIKTALREIAGGSDAEFAGSEGRVARVEQKNERVARVVEAGLMPKVTKLAGATLFDLFTLHPSKGAEKSFELNAHKTLPKKSAIALVGVLTVEATAWVRFS
ncbi:MAG TPA: hypothetical protein VHW03_04540 [Chthoniobacterales bacterium]|jgi:hypothetical protein|nr:hypothetical protein [Chthoniobacterales bacterium]